MKILILTVGGSHQPILTSIEQIKPDKVYFLCSDDSDTGKGSYNQVIGDGKVLKSDPKLDKCDLYNITKLANLSEDRYIVEKIRGFDDLTECYKSALCLIERIHKDFPEAKVVTDYTGGTKTMSIGLTMAATDDKQCEIALVTGVRRDLIKVTNHTQILHHVPIHSIQMERGLKVAKKLLSRFDYAGTRELIESLTVHYAGTDSTYNRAIVLCRAFEAWDCFAHEEALSLLNIYRNEFIQQCMFLESIVKPNSGHGYEMVEDLVLNAERRSLQDRYDDSIARLYRATEMLAQKRLNEYDIDTSDVDLAKINDAFLICKFEKLKNDKGKIRIGLENAWELLSTMENETLTPHYRSNEGKIKDFLKYRNNSIFAHGIQPIKKTIYDNVKEFIIDFIIHGIEITTESKRKYRYRRLQQFPTDFL